MIQYITERGVSMIKRIHLSNFKSFGSITLDLTGKNEKPKNMAFIYGENGSGKSNLVSSLVFLKRTFSSLNNLERIKNLDLSKVTNTLVNEADDSLKEVIRKLIKQVSLVDLVKEHKTIGNNKPMSIEIEFLVEDKEGSYSVLFNNDGVIEETLRFLINKRVGEMFYISQKEVRISPSVFTDNDYRKEIKDNISKYWGKHTLLGILFYEINNKNFDYIEERFNKNLITIINWFNDISVLYKGNKLETGFISTPYSFMRDLSSGTIKDENDPELKAFEEMINVFFTQLYSDVKKAFYKIKPEKGLFSYNLYFKKLINENIVEIPFSLESSGTQRLLDLLPYVYLVATGSTVIVDEADYGIHDLLITTIIEFLYDAHEDDHFGQFVATTHNTYLMQNLPREDIYVLSTDIFGVKNLISLDKYEFRTQKNHNVQSKYLRGDYSGIPSIGYFDVLEVVSEVRESIHSYQKASQTKHG
jgi:hypothetical protein